MIVSDNAAVVETDALSVTFTVKLLEPAVPGVPEIVPPADRLNPEGSVPTDTVHAYGGDPPEAASACEYAVPTVPAGSDAVPILKAGGLIVSDSAAVVETDALSVTFTVKLLDPAVPGVPDIVPPADRVNPDGRVPTDTVHVYGGVPPAAASACEYAIPAVPAGSDAVVIFKAGGLIVSDNAFVVLPLALSVTFTVKLLDPAVPGVPEIVPPADKVNPEGSVPTDTVHVYGGDPPEAASACEYAVPTVPAGSDAVVIVKAGLIVSDSAFVVLPLALSVTFTVKLLDPAAPGVPEIVPPVDKVNPAGSVPTDTVHVYGVNPPEAASACEYAVPTVPAGNDAVVIDKAGLMVNDNAFVATPPPLSANRTVKEAVPAAAGVPLMIPVEAAKLNPEGKAPSDIVQVTGDTAPDTARVAEYDEPATALGNVSVVITGLELTMICNGCVSVSPAPSTTFTVNGNVPRLVGIPLMVPPLLSDRPPGSAPPETDHV